MMKIMDRKKKALLTSALVGILLLWFCVRAYDEFSAYSPSNNVPTVMGDTGLSGDSAEQTVTENSTETISSGNVTETTISDLSNETENSGNSAVTGDSIEVSVTDNSTVSNESTMISTGDNSTITEGNDSIGTIIGDNSTETGSSENSIGSNSTETSTDTTEDPGAYSFEFLPPLRNGRFNLGSTIPVKFQLMDSNDNYVSTATASIMVDSVPGTASGSSNIDNLFRYDSENNQYIFDLSTVGMSAGSHIISVKLENSDTFSITVELV